VTPKKQHDLETGINGYSRSLEMNNARQQNRLLLFKTAQN